MKKLPLIFAGVLVGSSAFTSANAPADSVNPQGPRAPSFQTLDANKDGFISPSEATYQGISENKFVIWDSNGDDQLSEQEFNKGLEEKPDVGDDEDSY